MYYFHQDFTISWCSHYSWSIYSVYIASPPLHLLDLQFQFALKKGFFSCLGEEKKTAFYGFVIYVNRAGGRGE